MCFSTKKDLIFCLLNLLILPLLFLADYFYKDPLYKLTLEKLPSIQHNSSESSDKFFELMTQLGYGQIGAGIAFIAISFSTREKAFYILLVQTVESLTN